MVSSFKNTEARLEFVTDIDMLLMVEIRFRSGLCLPINRCAKTYNKYMRNFDKNKEY